MAGADHKMNQTHINGDQSYINLVSNNDSSGEESELYDNFKKPEDLTSSTKKSYNSRRSKNYDDNESDDGQLGYQDSQAPNGADITYVDTKGETFAIKPNAKMKDYANMFKDLIK